MVDGGSSDGTVEWARENGYQVYIQRQKGIRFAHFGVMPLVEGDIIISFSPDGNCLVEDIPPLIAKMQQGYDLVIGSRYFGGAKSEDDDFLTRFGNWFFTTTVNVLHGGHYTDAMTIFRAFRRDLPAELDLMNEEAYRLPEDLFGTKVSWEPLMSVRAAKAKKKIGEILAIEPKRIAGERKLQIWRWGSVFLFQFIRELFYWRPGRG